MLEFLYKLFIGHVHKYDIKEEVYIWKEGQTSGRPKQKLYIQQCTICGKLNQFKIKG